jgi:cell division protein FtsI/penicillin-binding protein 2
MSKHVDASRRRVRRILATKRSYTYVERRCALSDEARSALAETPGVEVEPVAGRIYPYNALASKVVGFVNVDNEGMAGAEASFESELRGTPGSEKVVKNGSYLADRYYRYVEREPVDGRHIYLTIDAVVQDVAETELRRALRVHRARAGTAIVLDVRNGDVVALAELPAISSRRDGSRADSMWTMRSLSHVYEPGSTFKIVTAAALLESHAVTLADSFDAENGKAQLGFAQIRDPHPYGVLSFSDAFKYSSNIVMAKASARVDGDEFYRYVRLFGFGSKTGVRMYGESGGTVLGMDRWSRRTQGTMAFGQEVAVTPLQMVCAMAAVANDGVMMLPRFVLGIAEANGRTTRFDPVRVRRVVGRSTAQTLRRLCRLVVEEGTGVKAAVDFTMVSGKTGTAQKASSRGGYLPGRYVASFAGFIPHDKPRLAVLVVLDEPRYASRYGGDSAAPAFARICRGIANSTNLLDDAIADRTVASRLDLRGERAPNFLRLERTRALELARSRGANVVCRGGAGRVIAQDPDPGAPIDRDELIQIYVSDGKDGNGVAPDVRGMTMRAARLKAARSGLSATFVGSGTVRRQVPQPGAQARGGKMKMYCDPGPPARNG